MEMCTGASENQRWAAGVLGGAPGPMGVRRVPRGRAPGNRSRPVPGYGSLLFCGLVCGSGPGYVVTIGKVLD